MSRPFTLQFAVDQADDGLLLREYLLQKQISKTALTDIKSTGALFVNGHAVTVRHQLHAGDYITVQFPPEGGNTQLPAHLLPLRIVYEDDALLLVEKPAGISTIPSRLHPTDTLANAIAYHYVQTYHSAAVHFVTRLDLDTSGLVLVAKHRHIHHLFSLAQQSQTITKEYLALVSGCPAPAEGRIELPIGRASDDGIRRQIHPDGQQACTLYQTVQTYAHADGIRALLRLRLLTGRTHQIRVHMAALGHPLLGDALYDGDCRHITRQALHCAFLQFTHPLTGELLQFESPLPADMQRLIP